MPSICTVRGFATRVAPFVVVLLGVPLFTATPPAAAALSAVPLGTAESFAVLAGSGITNTGATTIIGDIGTFPTPTETGVSSITLIGTDHAGDTVTQAAKDSLVTAYGDAVARTPATSLPVELGGTTLPPGVYRSGTFGLTGVLTLDSGGNPDATFVFQAGSTLITEVDSRVLLIGVDPCRVVWQVGSSATFKTGTDFVGDVLAYTSITAQTDATFQGRLLALNGAVTLDTNVITKPTCTATVPTTTTTVPTTTTTTVPGPPPTTTTTNLTTPTTTASPVPATMTTPPPGTPAAFVPSSPPMEGATAPPAVPAGPPSEASAAPPAVPAGPPAEASGGPPPTEAPIAPPNLWPGPPAQPPDLPVTGTNAAALLWTAFALLSAGAALILAGRRGRATRAA